MSEKFKKALRIAVNVGCGFEADAENAAELLTLITGLESRIAELEAERRWIPVSEPPKHGQYCAVLEVSKSGLFISKGYAIYFDGCRDCSFEIWASATHWYPVPNWNEAQLPEVQE